MGKGQSQSPAWQIAPPPQSCIRCGWCVIICPEGAHAAGLLEAAQQQDPELADRFGLDLCNECGDCALACPSGLPLTAAIRELKVSFR